MPSARSLLAAMARGELGEMKMSRGRPNRNRLYFLSEHGGRPSQIPL